LWWRLECRLGWRMWWRMWRGLGRALECWLERLGWRLLRLDVVGLALLTPETTQLIAARWTASN
jgi:hypothetical protein